MTGMERLVAAINGTPADRIPVFCNLLDQGAHELGLSPGSTTPAESKWPRRSSGCGRSTATTTSGASSTSARRRSCWAVGKIIFAEGRAAERRRDDHQLTRDIAAWVPDDICGPSGVRGGAEVPAHPAAEVGGTVPDLRLPHRLHDPAGPPDGDGELDADAPLRPARVRATSCSTKCHDFFVKEVAAYRAEAGADVLVYSNPFGSTDFVP